MESIQQRFVVLIFLVLLLPAPFSMLVQGQARPGGTLIIAIPRDLRVLKGGIHYYGVDGYVTGQIFDGLVGSSFNFTYTPRLAESWSVSSDGLAWTFNLRHNVKWHDGVPFTSADVKWSIENATIPFHPLGKSNFEALDHIETPDDYTVVFKLTHPVPWFLSYLTETMGGILPKHLMAGTDILAHQLDPPIVGTGAFMYKEYVPGDHVTLVRNPNYYIPGKPYLDTIIYKIIPNTQTAELALQNGEIDVIPLWLSPSDAVSLQSKGFSISKDGMEAYATDMELFFNLDKKNAPYADVRVRHAIGYAIDNSEIIQKATAGLGIVASGPIVSFNTYFDPNLPQYMNNVDEANKLLDEAGYHPGPDGTRFSLNLVYAPAFSSQHAIVPQILQEQLRAVGINLVLKPEEYSTMVDTIFTGRDFDIYMHNYAYYGADPVGLDVLYTSAYVETGVPHVNPAHYSNARIDELFKLVQSEVDPQKRAQEFNEIQTILVNDLPVIWIYQIPNLTAFNSKFVGLPAGPWEFSDSLDSAYDSSQPLPTTTAGPTTAVSTTSVSTALAYDYTSYAVAVVIVLVVLAVAAVALAKRRSKKT